MALERKGNGKVEGMEILLERASIIQCFCHAKGNIEWTLISQISATCVHKAWNLKYDTTEMTATTNEGCIGWLLENYYSIGKKWNF